MYKNESFTVPNLIRIGLHILLVISIFIRNDGNCLFCILRNIFNAQTNISQLSCIVSTLFLDYLNEFSE